MNPPASSISIKAALEVLDGACFDGFCYWEVGCPHQAYFSPGLLRLLGFDADESFLQNNSWLSLIHPEDREKAAHQLDLFRADRSRAFDLVLRFQIRPGGMCWLRCRGAFPQDADRHGSKIAITHTDVTEAQRRQASEAACNRIAQIGYWEMDLARQRIFWSAVTQSIHAVEKDYVPSLEEALSFYREGVDRNRIRRLVERAMQDGEGYDECFEITRADGARRWVRVIGFPEHVDGVCTRLSGTIQDIDEQRRAALALQTNEKKFRGIFNSTFSFIGFLDPSGILLEANDTALHMAGLEASDVIGKYFWDCYWWQISENTRADLKYHIARAAKGQESVYEVEVWIADRKPLTILFSLRPVFDSHGEVIYIIPEGRPIQEQVDARFRYQAIVEGTNVGTWEWNAQTGETRFNERWAEIVGYTLEEISPVSIATWIDFVHPEDLKASEAALKACFDGQTDYYEAECRMRHRDGHWIWVLDRGKVFSRTRDGKPLMLYGTHQDITERKQREEQLRQSEESFRNTFRYAGIGMALVGVDGAWLQVNPRLCQMLGYLESELLQLTFQDITHPDDLENDLDLLQQVIDGRREHYQIEKRYFHKAGHLVLVLLSVAVARNADGTVKNFISQVIDISEQRAARERISSLLSLANAQNTKLQRLHEELEAANSALREETITDPLTGLRNRRAFSDALNTEISRCHRGESDALALAMLDVDHFKPYNDTFGHPAGDDVLRLLAEHLGAQTRPYDTAARFGGEEFVVLMPQTSAIDASRICERLRATIEHASWPHRAITISIGISQWAEGKTADQLIQAADVALYEAKRDGRNRVVHRERSKDIP